MNKNFIAIYISFCIMIACIVLLPNKSIIFSSYKIDDNAKYIFHTSSIPKELETLDVEIIENGNEFILKCDKNLANEIKSRLTSILGETVTFSCSKKDALKLIDDLRCETIIMENIEGIYTYYGYSNKLDNFTYVNNQKVNIQLAYSNGVVTVGSPLILGDY